MSRNYQNHPDHYPDTAATDRYVDWLFEGRMRNERTLRMAEQREAIARIHKQAAELNAAD